jgi:hypothetical protein
MADERTIRHDDLARAFREGTVWDEDEAQLRTHIRTIAESGISNDKLIAPEIVRALAINHIQMARTITKLESTITTLNAENGKVSRRVLVLTVVTIVLGALQCLLAAIALCHP